MISHLHYITQDIPEYPHWQLAEEACKAGADWVQLRVKGKDYKEWKYIAQKTQEICVKYNAMLIVNDNVELAQEILADGVHLGKTDLKPGIVRTILGKNFIIGGTANTFEDIICIQPEEVDYIGLGPFRFTATKEKLSPILGIKGYEQIIKECRGKNIKIPVIAIGGIRQEDVTELMKTGIHGIAVSSAINLSDNKEVSVKEFLSLVNYKRY